MKRILLVLGSGGMKGMAHVGVLKALHRLEIPVWGYAGTSVGGLIAAYAASGLSLAQIERHALTVRRRDILDFNLAGLFLRRMRARSMYRGRALGRWIRRTVPIRHFRDCAHPLFINAVDAQTGVTTVFGLPSLDTVSVHEALRASAAIPGIFPPRRIGDRFYIDGGLVELLPVRLAKVLDVDLVIVVRLQNYATLTPDEVARKGFLSLMTQAHDVTNAFAMQAHYAHEHEVPRILIQPDVSHHHTLGFDNIAAIIAEGERATLEALSNHDHLIRRSWFTRKPKGRNALRVDADRCTGCGNCIVNDLFGVFVTTARGTADVMRNRDHPDEASAVHYCPFGAISIDPALQSSQRTPRIASVNADASAPDPAPADHGSADDATDGPGTVSNLLTRFAQTVRGLFSDADPAPETGTYSESPLTDSETAHVATDGAAEVKSAASNSEVDAQPSSSRDEPTTDSASS